MCAFCSHISGGHMQDLVDLFSRFAGQKIAVATWDLPSQHGMVTRHQLDETHRVVIELRQLEEQHGVHLEIRLPHLVYPPQMDNRIYTTAERGPDQTWSLGPFILG